MHAKYALALVLVLQVSLSLCEIPAPSQELVDKYNALRVKFFQRLNNLGLREKGQEAAERSEFITAYLKAIESDPRLQAAIKIITALREEAVPIVDRARLGLLALYERYLRTHLGQILDDGIANAQPVLDSIMPAK